MLICLGKGLLYSPCLELKRDHSRCSEIKKTMEAQTLLTWSPTSDRKRHWISRLLVRKQLETSRDYLFVQGLYCGTANGCLGYLRESLVSLYDQIENINKTSLGGRWGRVMEQSLHDFRHVAHALHVLQHAGYAFTSAPTVQHFSRRGEKRRHKKERRASKK